MTESAAVPDRRTVLAEIEAIYRNRAVEFRRVARAILGDSDAAWDSVQDGFARAVRDHNSYRGDGPLVGWVWACVMNATKTAAQSQRRATNELDARPADAAAREATPGNSDLQRLIQRLPERQRLVLFLRHYADLDYTAIAHALGIAPGTVAASLYAAHTTLRKALEETSHDRA